MRKTRTGQFLKKAMQGTAAAVGFVVAFLGSAPLTEPVLNFPSAKAQGAENRVQRSIGLLKSGDVKQRRQAAEMLGIIGNPGAFPELVEALKDDDSKVRANAAEALGKIRDPGAKPSLIDRLKDKSSEVRMCAASALGVIGVDDEEFKKILGMLLEGKTPEEKSGAVIALGVLQRAEAIQPLIEALEYDDSDLRIDIAWALTNIGKAAVPALIEVLKNADPYLRTYAAFLLGKMGDERALPALREVSRSYPVKEVREVAQEAIESITKSD